MMLAHDSLSNVIQQGASKVIPSPLFVFEAVDAVTAFRDFFRVSREAFRKRYRARTVSHLVATLVRANAPAV